MKSKILKLSTVILFFILIGAGCQKNDEIHTATGIIGEWQLIQFPEACVGFRDVMIKITKDSVFKRHIDGDLVFTSTFNVKPGESGYDTIFYHNPDADFRFEEFALLSSDTLRFVSPVLTAIPTCNYFKRKK